MFSSLGRRVGKWVAWQQVAFFFPTSTAILIAAWGTLDALVGNTPFVFPLPFTAALVWADAVVWFMYQQACRRVSQPMPISTMLVLIATGAIHFGAAFRSVGWW